MNHALSLVFSLLAIIVKNANGYFNLYLNLGESRRLIGVDSELYYVKEGDINEYAFNFIVPVPANIDDLHFTWQSLIKQPLSYSIEVESSSSTALLPPNLSIPSKGFLPETEETFVISLLCSGLISAEVDVIITITVVKDGEEIPLTFHRRKVCSKSGAKSGSKSDAKSALKGSQQTSGQVAISSPTYSNPSTVFYVALCGALVFIGMLAMVMVVCYFRNKKAERTNNSTDGPLSTFLTTMPRNSVDISYDSLRRHPSYLHIDQRSKDLQERISDLTIQRCRVRLSNVVLEGTFSRVYHGSYTTEDGVEEEVLIKTVTDHASQVQISLLLQEGMSMYSLSHKNILSILRVSIEDHTAPFLLYPYTHYTNLKVFLQKCKLTAEGVSHTLTTQEVVEMALQILEGVHYLHKKHLLHKDLAARNCVVDTNLRVQIADNALSRDLYPSDYHCLGDNENRPIKWLSIESLVQKTFSTSSDIWSYGVLMWELTTLAQQPYIEIDPFEMAAYLKDGYRLAQPVNCPDELFGIMAYCWAMSAEERPTVAQLQICIQEFYTQLIQYV